MAALLQKFETEMHNIEMKALFGGDSYDGNYIFELLEKAGVRKIIRIILLIEVEFLLCQCSHISCVALITCVSQFLYFLCACTLAYRSLTLACQLVNRTFSMRIARIQKNNRRTQIVSVAELICVHYHTETPKLTY